jgi:hypothetical protein
VGAALLDDHVLLLLLADNNSLAGLGANDVVGHLDRWSRVFVRCGVLQVNEVFRSTTTKQRA